jgi:hypothetical protein
MSVAIVPVTVPPSGDGPAADVSALVGPKTVTLTGSFRGSYTLLASHDGVLFVPVLLFDSDGPGESIQLTRPDAYAFVRLRSDSVAPSGVTCQVSGISKPGENLFADLATIPPGSSGSGAVDLAALFPPTGLESNLNVLCSGGFTGVLVVEASQDGVDFNPLGTFTASPQPRPLVGLPPALEFSPLSSPDNVRYLRATVQGVVVSPVTLTVGGTIAASNVSSGAAVVLDESSARAAIENGTLASTEVILYEWEVPGFGALPATIRAQLGAIVRTQTTLDDQPTGVVRVYVGATNPGDTTGAALVLTVPGIANFLDTPVDVAGTPFANPGGNNRVQLTGQVDAPGAGNVNELDVRGIVLGLG